MASTIVLTFHGIQCSGLLPELTCDSFIKRYTLTVHCFEQIIAVLSPKMCCSVSELSKMPGGDWLTLTFDDGFISDFEIAFPLLIKRRLTGTFFINPDNIGKKGYCNQAQLKEMAKAGMEIGSHGLTHRYLTTMPHSDSVREICESKQRLEQELGVEVTSFAAVGGQYRPWMCNMAYEAGYRAFATMIPGKTLINKEKTLLRRNHIQSHHDEIYVSQLLKGQAGTLMLNRIRFYAFHIPKTVLGIRHYDRAKKLLLRVFSAHPISGISPGGGSKVVIYLSIIVPIRNEDKFIVETLNALAGQDYPKERFELIIVDGMSTDATRSLVEKFAADHPDLNIRLLDNLGRLSSSARNIGVRESKGLLIGVIDGHVFIPNNKLFANMELLKEKNRALCLARPAPLDVPGLKRGKPFWIAVARKSWLGHSRNSYIYSHQEGFIDPVSSGFAYDRSIFDNVGYFDESFDAAEDVEFHFRLKQAGIQAYTAQDLLIYSYPRESLGALFRQQVRYGDGRARLVRKHISGFTKETLVPAMIFIFFVIFLLVIIFSERYPVIFSIYAGSMGLYWIVLLFVGFVEAVKRKKVFPSVLVAMAIWTTHMGLGWGFLKTIFLPKRFLTTPTIKNIKK